MHVCVHAYVCVLYIPLVHLQVYVGYNMMSKACDHKTQTSNMSEGMHCMHVRVVKKPNFGKVYGLISHVVR